MSLRMSICAVISLGLTVGAHWVAGQAAQAPPNVSASQGSPRGAGTQAPSATTPSQSATADAPTPPRVASPSGPASPGASGAVADAAASPPRVPIAPEPSGAAVVDLPDLPIGAEPPAVSPTPPVGELPIIDAAPAPPAVPADQFAGSPAARPDPFEAMPEGMALPVPAYQMTEAGRPAADGPGDPVYEAGAEPPDVGGMDLPGIAPAPPAGGPGVADGGIVIPGLDGGPTNPGAYPIAGAADGPAFEAPDSALPEPGLPMGDPGMPAPAASPPEFSAAEPPADPSLRTSAVPPEGVGAMADTLADRLSEGPRSVGPNLVVDQPPTSNVNLPMKAVITLRNDGRDDAFNAVVRLPLPDGLEYIESSPAADSQEGDGRVLVWSWSSLAAGDTRVIELTVKPLKAVPMDLVPQVTSVIAAKGRTAVQEPKLKIDLVGPNGPVLKGTDFDFQITVRNVGNGPARRVNLVATLSGGLKGYDHNGELSDAPRFEQLIGDLQPGEVWGPVPLSALADGHGEHSCSIEAISPDVVPPTPLNEKKVTIVVPDLLIDLFGPESKPVGSTAEYVVTVTNTGSAAATDVAVALFAPESGDPKVPSDAKYRQDPERRLHSIYWRLPRLDKGESRQYRVPIRLDRIANYHVEVAAHSEGFREPKDTRRAHRATQVIGIPDLKIIDVARKDPVIDVGDTTVFEITIKNIGSMEATNVQVDFFTNDYVLVERTDPPDARTNPENPNHHGFAPIDRLAMGADRTYVVTVKAQKPGPSVANFDVKVFWDGLPEESAVSSNNHVRIAEGQLSRSGSSPPR